MVAGHGSNSSYLQRYQTRMSEGGSNMDMHFCRKIHSLWLRQSGIVSEEIDLLQGRVNPSVFSRRYLTPIASLQDKVLETPNRLNTQLQIDDHDNNWQYLYKLMVMPN